MEIIHGPGYCPKCQNALLTVNDVKKCIYCDAKKQVEGNASTVEDPGEEGLASFTQKATLPITNVQKMHPLGTIDDAIKIMRSLPMPDDVKQFRKIKKVIDLMEQLRG